MNQKQKAGAAGWTLERRRAQAEKIAKINQSKKLGAMGISPEQSKSRAEQSKSRAEQSKSRAEQSKSRAEQSRTIAKTEQIRKIPEQTHSSPEHNPRAEQSTASEQKTPRQFLEQVFKPAFRKYIYDSENEWQIRKAELAKKLSAKSL